MKPSFHTRACLGAWLLGSALLALPSPSTFARSLTGLVTNAATGATLEGARIVIKDRNLETVTDNLGFFTFEDLAPGPVVLVATYTGLAPAEAAVEIPAAGRARKDISLTADIYRLSAFVVGSEREGNAKAITLQRLSDGVKSIVSADAFGGLAGNPADLAGDDDLVTLEHTIAMYRALPQAQLAVVPNASHLLLVEHPGLLREVVATFLGTQPSPTLMPIRRAHPAHDA